MKKLKLNDETLNKLIDILKIDQSLIEKESINVNVIKGNDIFFENILDNLSNYLLQYGLDEKDEPNSIGIEIEQLIDKVSEIYYE